MSRNIVYLNRSEPRGLGLDSFYLRACKKNVALVKNCQNIKAHSLTKLESGLFIFMSFRYIVVYGHFPTEIYIEVFFYNVIRHIVSKKEHQFR